MDTLEEFYRHVLKNKPKTKKSKKEWFSIIVESVDGDMKIFHELKSKPGVKIPGLRTGYTIISANKLDNWDEMDDALFYPFLVLPVNQRLFGEWECYIYQK